jgi:uncharacterized protein YdhG (YjbR/CyaY superfamily)
MATSKAATVKEYLEGLPTERRRVVAKVRAVVKKNLPRGYQETMNWGAIAWEIPLTRYPNTYNKQPLCYIGLAAQKNYYALYLMSVYLDPKRLAKLRAGFKEAGKKLDMGKSCVRFKTLGDLPLDTIGEIVASMTPETYITMVEAARK